MKRNEYTLLLLLGPAVVFIVLLIGVFALWKLQNRPRPARMLRFIAVNTFGKVLYQSVEGGRMKLYFLGREVTDDLTARLAFRGLTFLATSLFISVFTLFWSMLLLEGSYDCTDEFDCFDYNNAHNEPLNCSSEVVLNGTIQLVCFRVGFNYVFATGAAYGLFKLDVFAVYLFSMFLFWLFGLEKVRESGFRGLLFILSLVEIIVLAPMYAFSLLTLSPKYYKIFPPMVKVQYSLSLATVGITLFLMVSFVPWVRLRKTEDPIDDGVGIPGTEEHRQKNDNERGLDNMAAARE